MIQMNDEPDQLTNWLLRNRAGEPSFTPKQTEGMWEVTVGKHTMRSQNLNGLVSRVSTVLYHALLYLENLRSTAQDEEAAEKRFRDRQERGDFEF
jgi:hypothetical protein